LETPIAYKVSDKNDKLFWATIDIGIFRIRFTETKRGGDLVLEYKARMDGARLYDSSKLYVSKDLYDAAKEQAYAIRRDQRERAQKK